MGRVLTNNTGFAFTIETALGVAGTVWTQLEPESVSEFGATIDTVSRNPISKSRQRRKGTITDLNSSVSFEHDATLSVVGDFVEGFLFATAVNGDVTGVATTAAETTGDSYAVAALTAAQADKMEVDTLIWVKNYLTAANNGLKVVDADIATSAIAISVAENLVNETAPASANLSFAGHRIATGDTVTWNWDGTAKTGTLTETGVATILQALGLTVGETVHIGSILVDGSTTVGNAFENSATDDMFGYVRVASFPDANSVVFDKVAEALQFDDLTDPAAPIDLIFGRFIRNVDVDDSEYLEQSYQFEAAFPNLFPSSADGFEYALGNFADTMSIAIPLTDKAAITFGFIGTDTQPPVAVGSRKTGASTAALPLETVALNTTSDVARLRIRDTDDSGLTTDFKSITLTLGNNVSPEKVIAVLGAKFMNTGNFDVGFDATVLFTDPDVPTRIRNNTTVSLDLILQNDDGVVVFDIPSLTLGGGAKEFPVNESVRISLTGEAFRDAVFDTSVGVSIIPVPLPTREIV